ncbi:hypothetical protein GCM10022420_024180 [Streptomyces iranensis]
MATSGYDRDDEARPERAAPVGAERAAPVPRCGPSPLQRTAYFTLIAVQAAATALYSVELAP